MRNTAGRVSLTLFSSLLVIPAVLLISHGASANDDKHHDNDCGDHMSGDRDSARHGDRHHDGAGHNDGEGRKGRHSAILGDHYAEVVHGENQGSFPAVGGTYVLDLGDGRGEATVYFESEQRMSFLPFSESADGAPVFVDYSFMPVNDDVYVIGWLDDEDQEWMATIDFASGEVCHLAARSEGDWRGYRGTICPENVDLSGYVDYALENSTRVSQFWPRRGRLDWQQGDKLRSDSSQKRRASADWVADQPGNYKFPDHSGLVSYLVPPQLEDSYVDSRAFNAANREQCSALLSRQLGLRSSMRQLWDEHVMLTRLYIVSAIDDMPDKQAVTDRLLQNQVDIGNAFKPYYGESAGTKLTALLTEHIVQATEVLAAAKSGDTSRLDKATSSWTANADSLAVFLDAANPDNWPQSAMRPMLNEHLNLTISEVRARLSGDWEADLSAFQRIHEQALEMADGLSTGVIAQFPEQF